MTEAQERELEASFMELDLLMRSLNEAGYDCFRNGFLQACYCLTRPEDQEIILRFAAAVGTIDDVEDEDG